MVPPSILLKKKCPVFRIMFIPPPVGLDNNKRPLGEKTDFWNFDRFLAILVLPILTFSLPKSNLILTIIDKLLFQYHLLNVCNATSYYKLFIILRKLNVVFKLASSNDFFTFYACLNCFLILFF